MVSDELDTFKHKGMRRKLVEELKNKGITDVKVLSAIDRIPRHLFMESSFINFAYEDKAFPIGAGQTISQPYTVAFQTQLLNVSKGSKILEIGTGSGYQACVLLELGAKVYTVERQKLLYDKVRSCLNLLGYSPLFFFGDGYLGLKAYAPFDGIIVTCGAPYIPEALLMQLKVGGRLVIPVGEGDIQIMTCIVRVSETEFEKKEHGEFRFVPMLGNKNL